MTRDDTKQAISPYREAFTISKRLATNERANASLQRDFSAAGFKLGDVLQSNGEAVEAKRLYDELLVVRQTLADSDPENTLLRRDLSDCHFEIAQRLSDPVQQDRHLQAALQIADDLLRSAPGDAALQQDVDKLPGATRACASRAGGHYGQ